MRLEEQLKAQLKAQERFKFLENPTQYVMEMLKEDVLANTPAKRFLETDAHYEKRVLEINKKYNLSKKHIMEIVNEAVSPVYIYYKGQKLQVPNDFYIDYKTPDKESYIKHLIDEDKRNNVVTAEDREKARLLNCNLDYNYLQTLINKMNVNPDLVVSIKTNDGAIINIRKQEKQELDDGLSSSIFISPEKVR